MPGQPKADNLLFSLDEPEVPVQLPDPNYTQGWEQLRGKSFLDDKGKLS